MHTPNDDIVSKQDFDDMKHEKNYKYELIDGIVNISQKNNLNEKNVIIKLATEINAYLKNKPFDIFTDVEVEISNDFYYLDLCIVNKLYELNTYRLKAIPIIAVDIISQDKSMFEAENRIQKFKAAGIKEYWLINIKTRSLYILTLSNKIHFEYIHEDNIKSSVLVDFAVSTNEIFQ